MPTDPDRGGLAVCGAPSPVSEALCDLPAGHEGQHHGYSWSDMIENLRFEQWWDDGFQPPAPAAFINRHGAIFTAGDDQ